MLVFSKVFTCVFVDDEEVECPPESLISKSVLSELCGETAKLKSLGVLNQVSLYLQCMFQAMFLLFQAECSGSFGRAEGSRGC